MFPVLENFFLRPKKKVFQNGKLSPNNNNVIQ